MKKYKVLAFALLLAVVTAIAAWFHLSTREEIPAGTLQITFGEQTCSVALSQLDCQAVSGIRVNGKGESIPVEGQGVSLDSLLEEANIRAYSRVAVISDDAYRAELTAEEVKEAGKAYLLLQDEALRLVVFGDRDSKRSVSNVVQLVVE